MATWLAGIGGEIIKLDHSFKASKRIRDSSGQQQFAAVLTLMNEFGQVRGLHKHPITGSTKTDLSQRQGVILLTISALAAVADPCYHPHQQQVPDGGRYPQAPGGLHGQPGKAGRGPGGGKIAAGNTAKQCTANREKQCTADKAKQCTAVPS